MNELIINCEECEHKHFIDESSFEIEIVDVDPGRDSGLGATNHYSGEYELSCENKDCENNMTIEVDYWEYPVGSLESSEFKANGGTIEQEFKIDVTLD